ncbi:hypothetical protein C6Y53_14590 [Pukyongiella litopenaei]|uniref:Fenitrothion hydrolase n=2 Tax=Pukyongiella litopenaei TaxID=2605946 RepID=A0A2S0MSG1_9RHOB|nr:hypothetical protein C6Y53_14590 [Pukyongiella litopenaei]
MALAVCAGAPARAHVSEGGLVLLLPTDIYIAAGVAVVAATVALLALLPARAVAALFRPRRLRPGRGSRARRMVTNWAAFAVLAALVWSGLAGPRDPLANLLPLVVWTVWWIMLVALQGLAGDLWSRIDPWRGPVAVARRLSGPPPLRLPARLGHAPAIAILLCFVGFLLADPAPTDPARLAVIVALYWLSSFAALVLFGARWRYRGEAVGVLMRSYGRLGVMRHGRVGLTGWQLAAGRVPPAGLALFMLLMLGSGSFDGLNETFWWFARMGWNPLEFPGRSAVIGQTLAGLAVANLVLVAGFALAVRAGLWLAGGGRFRRAFRALAPSVLPIALGYHLAHYLTSFLVDGQYVLVALNDPLATGADLLGMGETYVTTGFFNTPASVRMIWLSQAGAVVLGHVLAVLLAHAIALRELRDPRRAALSQAPLAAMMVLYTLFSLWLLASPRGI